MEERKVLSTPSCFFLWTLLFGFLLLSSPAFGQDFPVKPITLYCGYEAGATTDLTTRGLAAGAEKLLGVPVMVENKAGGGAAVAAGLVASKKPDGYTLAVVSTGAITVRPHLFKVSYKPLQDFTLVAKYSSPSPPSWHISAASSTSSAACARPISRDIPIAATTRSRRSRRRSISAWMRGSRSRRR